MKLARTLSIAGLLVLGATWGSPSRAAEDPIVFLHAMQDGGYADVAVDYLKTIKGRPDAPKEITQLWDLEMSRSLRAAAKSAYNETERNALMENAQKYLQKFLTENPDLPEAIRAGAWWADISGQEALQDLRHAKEIKDEAKRNEAIAKVRKTLEEIRPRFVKALASYQDAIRKTDPKSRKLLELQAQATETRLKIAITNFYLAQISDPKSRGEKLNAVAKEFDAIHQENRASIFGIQAHFLHGRTAQEDGNFDMAQSIYEEVLASDMEDRGTRRPRDEAELALVSLLAEAEQYYLQCLAHKS